MKNLKKVLGFVGSLMVVLCLFTGCKKDETNYMEGTDEALAKNVKTELVEFQDDKYAVFVENKNNVAVDYLFEFELYDESGKKLDTAGGGYTVGANKKIVFDVDLTKETYDSYKKVVYAAKHEDDYKKYYFDGISITIAKEGEDFMATFKNNNNENIGTIDATIVYYKDKKIVAVDTIFVDDINANESKKEEIYEPLDENHNYISYDSYDVTLLDAFTRSDF